jgi:hypothetical protein
MLDTAKSFISSLICKPDNSSADIFNSTEIFPINNLNENVIDITNLIKKIVSVNIFSLAFLIGFIGNALVIYLIVRIKKLQSITNIFLLSLATSDLLLITICVPIKVNKIIFF